MCETNPNIMSNLLACRICLATNINLYNMDTYSLRNMYEDLTGATMSIPDSYPHYLCGFCQRLLVKTSMFKARCLRSLEMLKRAAMVVPMLTPEHIQTLSLSSSPIHSLSPCAVSFCTIDPCNETPPDIPIKEENEDLDDLLKEELSDQSDEEPLSKKVIKKRQKKIDYVGFEFDNETVSKKLDYAEFDNDNFETEKDYSEFEFGANAFESKDLDQSLSIGNDDIGNYDMDIVILSKEEQIQEILARKESQNYQNSFYKCELCFKGFMTDSTYKNHMTRHDPSVGPLSCDICHTRWSEARLLKAHRIIAHERKFICKLCNYVARSRNRAKEHIRYHKGHTYMCKICGASFSKSTSHLTHVRLQHPSKFCCDLCGESFIGQIGLNMHKKKTHDQCKNSLISQFSCSLCRTKFKSIEALKQHTDLSENGVCDSSQSPCVYCGNNFGNPELLKEHLRTHQVATRCEECDRTFVNERSFAVHCQRVHLGVKHKHRRHSRRGAPVVCEMCGKKCLSSASLVYHQRIHTGEKPYQCTQCPKRFSVYQRLQIHIRTHTGERPFKCIHCPKAFKHKAALNRHDRVHTGAKPYQCPHCPKSFSQSNSMKLHVRTVHLKLPGPFRDRRKNKNTE